MTAVSLHFSGSDEEFPKIPKVSKNKNRIESSMAQTTPLVSHFFESVFGRQMDNVSRYVALALLTHGHFLQLFVYIFNN